MEEFGALIKAHRTKSRMSMRNLAEAVGISAPFLCDIESGKRKPPAATVMESMVDVFNLSETETKKLYDAYLREVKDRLWTIKGG